MHAQSLAAVVAIVLAGGDAARADEKKPLDRVVEGELGLAVVYSNTDFVSLGGFVGFTFGKPILDLFYVEPVLHGEFSLFGGGRFAGLLRCNFVPAVGTVVSLGFGAGTGWKTMTDDNFESFSVGRDFREVELAIKLGGKRRFLIGLALSFDTNEMGEESKAVMLQTTLVRAAP
jgi:hypothetical protein